MSGHTREGGDTSWVGRSIRRVEDPALVRGQGRFTADLPAARREASGSMSAGGNE